MTFYNFTKITPPPNDELVNEATQLNGNWDKLATRLNEFQQVNTNAITGTPPVGTQALISGMVNVWDGSAWRVPDHIPSGWGAWTTFGLQSPVLERTGYTPMYRVNSIIRKVMLSGALRADSGAGAWPLSRVKVTSATSGIPSTYQPVFSHFQQVATAAATDAGDLFEGARLEIVRASPVELYVHWQGDNGGGNFVTLDGVSWWY